MERILVIMTDQYHPWEALGRAVALAKRISARVFVLKVFSQDEEQGEGVEQDKKTSAGIRLENMIQTARTDSIGIDYFVTEGDFEEEVIRFVDNNKISILVAETGEWDSRHCENPGKGLGPIQDIMYRISCRVELVSPKKIPDNEESER